MTKNDDTVYKALFRDLLPFLDPITEIQDLLDKAGVGFVELPIDQWAGWIVYLLEALDAASKDMPQFEDWLGGVRDAVITRLSGGTW